MMTTTGPLLLNGQRVTIEDWLVGGITDHGPALEPPDIHQAQRAHDLLCALEPVGAVHYGRLESGRRVPMRVDRERLPDLLLELEWLTRHDELWSEAAAIALDRRRQQLRHPTTTTPSRRHCSWRPVTITRIVRDGARGNVRIVAQTDRDDRLLWAELAASTHPGDPARLLGELRTDVDGVEVRHEPDHDEWQPIDSVLAAVDWLLAQPRDRQSLNRVIALPTHQLAVVRRQLATGRLA